MQISFKDWLCRKKPNFFKILKAELRDLKETQSSKLSTNPQLEKNLQLQISYPQKTSIRTKTLKTQKTTNLNEEQNKQMWKSSLKDRRENK